MPIDNINSTAEPETVISADFSDIDLSFSEDFGEYNITGAVKSAETEADIERIDLELPSVEEFSKAKQEAAMKDAQAEKSKLEMQERMNYFPSDFNSTFLGRLLMQEQQTETPKPV